MHSYFFQPEVVRVALVVGVVVSMLFYERVQLTTGGAIVPAYLALHLPAPLYVLTTLLIGYLTYLLVSVVLARRLILYGRRKFEVEVLVGLALTAVASVVGSRLGGLDPVLLGLSGIGFLVPGVLAHDMVRQRPGKTLFAVLVTTGILGLFTYVYTSLLAIAPVQLPQPVRGPDPGSVGFPPELLLGAALTSVLIGMLVFARLRLRSGGFITGAYLALVAPRWPDVVFAVVLAVATWAVVVHLLMPRLLLFGRRKLSTMVLVGAVLTWAAEIAVTEVTGGTYEPWSGLTIITLMVPALLANDAQRQGWERTAWGAGITTLGVYGVMNLAAAVGLSTGLLSS
ncbi:MAG: poly-gamma-glutamate biosynthesis protein PgsC/CapC [Actinomycetota bacterium]|nr:poly-gamma-glutamate biosynthesis protein PgsC/CapC [Actinomycetota bacterium]